ncbi:MAG: agmatine deiminase family protein, partial [Caulobacteraceae bacterium]|nr:agmatine deiminase family protein [Caulobacteraceae bacterium]
MVPGEWAPHLAVWLGFPSHPDLWLDDLGPARREAADLVRALAGPGGERVRLAAAGRAACDAAGDLVGDVAGVEIVDLPFGDIWLRDTGPIFTAPDAAAAFAFNGWGGKYRLAGDEAVAERIAAASGAKLARHGCVLEGGAIDHDGQGTVVTTRQCLLNPNRNP